MASEKTAETIGFIAIGPHLRAFPVHPGWDAKIAQADLEEHLQQNDGAKGYAVQVGKGAPKLVSVKGGGKR